MFLTFAELCLYFYLVLNCLLFSPNTKATSYLAMNLILILILTTAAWRDKRNNADVVLKFSCRSRNSTWQKTYNKTANPIRFWPMPRFIVSHKGENVYDELPGTKFNPFFLLVCEYLKTLCKRLPLLQPDFLLLNFPKSAAQGFIVRWLVMTEKTQLV